MYFIEVMDCEGELRRVYNRGTMPRVLTELNLSTVYPNNSESQFSYEDSGQLSLHILLSILVGTLFVLSLRTYMQYYKVENRLLSPHPIMIYALAAQLSSLILQTIHLIFYSADGKGVLFLDVMSKIC